MTASEEASEELRRMLDERGVEWWDDSSIYGTRRTVWKADGVTFVAAEVSGRLKVSGYLTPEQAIEATLGADKAAKRYTAKIRELEDKNAKLREVAERAWKTAERLCQAFDGPCSAGDVTIAKPCPMGERDEECVYGQLQMELRELGIEVDA